MSPTASVLEAELAYTRAQDVTPDGERPGLLRARTRGPAGSAAAEDLDSRLCRIRDWGGEGGFRPSLLRHGFDCVALPPDGALAARLERVRAAGYLEEEDARAIRARLAGRSLQLGDGSRVRLLHIAAEGLILRVAGPDRMAMTPPGSLSAMNGHDAASAVHADQDVLGTPLRQILRGAAPWLFRHEAPDSRNRWSPLLLLNLWIPLQQITRPLALMDTRSLDRRAQQLRYGLPVANFLERHPDRRVNDIWTFLPDARQQWTFRAEMALGTAYLFETLGTPHGSFVVPGEQRAARRHRQLDAARAAIGRGDARALARALEPAAETGPPPATLPLERAIRAMDDLLAEARLGAEALCRGEGREDWCARAARAMDAVVRKSIEMRVVALRTPRLGRGRARAGP